MTAQVRVGVVHVYDPATGWATDPVAVAGWTDQRVWWAWVPTEPARRCRADLSAMTPTGQVRWLVDHSEDPGVVAAVDLLDIPDVDVGGIEAVLDSLVDDVMVGLG